MSRNDGRYRQANRETMITVCLYALFFAWWYLTAYGLGAGDPKEYSYVLGLPSWFFWSCVAGYFFFSFLVWGVVRAFFREVPLDDGPEERVGEKEARP